MLLVFYNATFMSAAKETGEGPKQLVKENTL